MDFEFDPTKSRSNKDKHGIDFEEAQELWKDGNGLAAPTRSESERRFVMIGCIGQRHWTAVYTHRDAAVRLISVRRSRPEEIERYEDHRQKH